MTASPMSSTPERRPGSLRGPQCASCGGLTGAHEPVVHVVAGIATFTSRAVDPGLSVDSPGLLYHAPCYEIGRQARRRGFDSDLS